MDDDTVHSDYYKPKSYSKNLNIQRNIWPGYNLHWETLVKLANTEPQIPLFTLPSRSLSISSSLTIPSVYYCLGASVNCAHTQAC